eukprot:100219-Chlamydomonas_euryale.AAC.1
MHDQDERGNHTAVKVAAKCPVPTPDPHTCATSFAALLGGSTSRSSSSSALVTWLPAWPLPPAPAATPASNASNPLGAAAYARAWRAPAAVAAASRLPPPLAAALYKGALPPTAAGGVPRPSPMRRTRWSSASGASGVCMARATSSSSSDAADRPALTPLLPPQRFAPPVAPLPPPLFGAQESSLGAGAPQLPPALSGGLGVAARHARTSADHSSTTAAPSADTRKRRAADASATSTKRGPQRITRASRAARLRMPRSAAFADEAAVIDRSRERGGDAERSGSGEPV